VFQTRSGGGGGQCWDKTKVARDIGFRVWGPRGGGNVEEGEKKKKVFKTISLMSVDIRRKRGEGSRLN